MASGDGDEIQVVSLGTTQQAIPPTFVSILLVLFAVIFKFLTTGEPSYQQILCHLFAQALPWGCLSLWASVSYLLLFLIRIPPPALELTPILFLSQLPCQL